jgi:SNF2 family DNA or RNA helicase
MKLALSGTPFRSSLTKSWGVLNWLEPTHFSSFWKYADELFHVSGPDTGPRTIGKLRSEEALQDVLRPYYLARTKADVAPWLPPVQREMVYLPMDNKQAQAYRSILDDAYAELEGGRLNANGILAELTRLRQFACAYGRLGPDREFQPALPSNKLEWILQFLEEMWEIPERKVVMASGFTKLANLFAGAIMAAKYPTITLTGETSSRQREIAQDTFLEDPNVRVIVINLYAGGEAIDLSSADDLILVDEPWTDAPRQQVENRIQNLAKQQQVTVHYLRSENSIDQQMAEMNDEQRRALLAARPEALREFLRQ